MFVFLKIISLVFQLIPRRLALFAGRMLGLFVAYFLPLRKNIAMQNLSIAFPDWDRNKKKLVLKACYKHFGMVLIDFFRLPKVKSTKNKLIVNIPTNSIALFNKYNSGIILSGHLGNWEYIGPILGIHDIKCAGIAQIQKNSSSNLFFNELRASENVKIVPVNSGGEVMIKLIKEGYYLGLISDQNAGSRGTQSKFFNKPVSVPKGAAAFHLKTNSPILLGFCILSKNYNYNLSFNLLDIEGLPDNFDDAIMEINHRFTKLLEQAVRKNPEQYFWFHRKWNRELYKGISNK